MNDDIERRLRQASPRGAPPELRPRVRAAVAEQLQRAVPLPSPWSFLPAIVVAAGLLAGIALNYWVNETLDRRLAVVLGPPPLRRQAAEIAADVASITDPVIGQWAYEQLSSRPPRGEDARQYAVRLQGLIQQFTVDWKETADETPRKNPQMDRDRRGSRDRYPADAQRLLRMEHRNTA